MGAGGAHTVGQTVEAGLPNIDGIATRAVSDIWSGTGPFYNAGTSGEGFSGGGFHWTNLGFQASRANPIYGNSDTVQPPAYFVNIWKRIA